jgi:pSer/pThr/pTyr-binding forkhead associated (FHA) protein
MRVILEIVSGSCAGKKVKILDGQVIRVGRLGPVDVLIGDDPRVSNVHFVLECQGEQCRLRDLNSRFGTILSGARVTTAIVRDGDRIVAGQTTFVVRIESDLAAPAPAAPTATPVQGPEPPPAPTGAALSDRVLQILHGLPEPLFALLDAARDPKVLELVRSSGAEYQSLYEGPKGDELADWAPYVMRLAARSCLLETLVREGWRNSWGIYFTSRKTLAEVRKHFRHFLMVRLEDGRDAYFRFYDPRVLRVYLPSCNPVETTQFFGPVRCYLMEAKQAETLLQFIDTGRGAGQKAMPLAI